MRIIFQIPKNPVRIEIWNSIQPRTARAGFQINSVHDFAWLDLFEVGTVGLGTNKSGFSVDDDDCFHYHFRRNNAVIAFGTLSSFNPVYNAFLRFFCYGNETLYDLNLTSNAWEDTRLI